MTIKWSAPGESTPILTLSGALNFARRNEFLSAMHALSAHEHSGSEHIHIDLAGLEAIDSAGLGLLLTMRDHYGRQGRAITLIKCSQPAREAFRLAGFNKLFAIQQ